jgi:aspartyl-tRNA synthetase
MTEPAAPAQPSKNALKKAAKEAEKAKKKAEQARLREEELQLRQRQEAESDFAAGNYGEQVPTGAATSQDEWVRLSKIEESEDKLCIFRCAIENSRIQSAKLGFLTVSQGLDTIQVVVAEDGESVSRQMVKFAADIPSESLCLLHGIVKRTPEKIKSATVQDFEIRAKKIYIVSKAHTPLPIQPADSERALPSETKEEEDVNSPLVSLNTRLNNRVLDLRAKINQSIFILKDGVDSLFQEFLRARGFIRIHTPKIVGAPSEGTAPLSS